MTNNNAMCEWTCGHVSHAVCGVCHQRLIVMANRLQRFADAAVEVLREIRDGHGAESVIIDARRALCRFPTVDLPDDLVVNLFTRLFDWHAKIDADGGDHYLNGDDGRSDGKDGWADFDTIMLDMHMAFRMLGGRRP
jgi:hypothetical protein